MNARWTLPAAALLLGASLWLPSQAAPPVAQTSAEDAISFEQYREFRVREFDQRRARLDRRLAAPGLSAEQKARLDEQKAYYDWLAAMPDQERDRRFRERFDMIDANHDGQIDAAERAAWREKQRDRYRQQAATRDMR